MSDRLVAAIEARDTARIRAELALGRNLELRTPEGLTPLMVAADVGGLEGVSLLLEAGAEVDARSSTRVLGRPPTRGIVELEETNPHGFRRETAPPSTAYEHELLRTPLMFAAEAGHAEVVTRLLAAGADPNARDADGHTPLIYAAGEGQLSVTRELLEAGADPLLSGQRGESALHHAVLEGRLDLVELLCDRGVPPDLPAAGVSPLALAVREGHDAVVEELLRRGARPGLERGILGSPLEGAVEQGRVGILELLLAKEPPPPAMGGRLVFNAIQRGQAALIAPLAAAGAALEALDDEGHTPLVASLVRGESACMEALLEAGANPDAPAASVAPLAVAASQANAQAASRLLAAGAAVDGDTRGPAPLALATAGGATAVVEALLEAGAEVSGEAVERALVSACLAGHSRVVDLLEAAGARASGLEAARLIQAVRTGDADAVRALLTAGGDASATDPTDPRTPSALHLAAAAGNVEVCRALLEHGATVDAVTSSAEAPWGRTPLMVAAAAGYGEVVSALLEHGADPQLQDRDYEEGERTALMLAAAGGNVTTVRILLKGGADPNVKDQEGLTALMHAALSGETAILRLLLSAGARVDARCSLGQSALIYAAQEGNRKAVETLLDAGADVGTLPPEGWSALAAAVYGGHMDVIQLLIAAGADLDEADRDQPPLALAVTEGHVDVLNLLLESGANPDASAAGGLNALMLCALGEHSALADCLLQAGADVDARDGEDQTALMLAAHHGRLGLVQVLLEAGADPRLRDREGRSAREHARRGEQPAVLALLEATSGEGPALPPAEEPATAADEQRGLADYFGEGRALLVAAPLTEVARALGEHRGGQHLPEVQGQTRELPPRCLRLTTFAGVPWVVVQHEARVTAGELGESDAAALSASLGCGAIFLATSDEAGTLQLRHFREGHLAERLDYGSGEDEDLDETRYWRAGVERAHVEIDDPYDFTDERLRALEAYVPAALAPGEVGSRRHVAAPPGATRVDWVARR